MKAPAVIINNANKIASSYCKGFIEPKILQQMYNELEEIGITTGLICGDPSESPKSCEWYIDGAEVENSLFMYSIYKSNVSNKIEYNIYFS